MTKLLVIAEHDGEVLNPSTARTLACARALEPEALDVAVFASEGEDIAAAAARLQGVSRVLLINHPANQHPLACVLAPQVVSLAAGYSHIFAPGTTFGRDFLPRVAALLGVPQITDIMTVRDPFTFDRPIYAGNAVTTVKAPEGKVVATVRPASFKPVEEMPQAAPVEAMHLDVQIPEHTRFEKLHSEKGDRPDLQSARIVVSGGRGVGGKEDFERIFRLADRLGAAVGASRAAVDAGVVPNELQVGQTGKIIAPEVYIAFGISGAIQHLAGIKDAGTIVAVNTDPDAPIFEVADLGLVADWKEVVEAMEKAVDEA